MSNTGNSIFSEIPDNVTCRKIDEMCAYAHRQGHKADTMIKTLRTKMSFKYLTSGDYIQHNNTFGVKLQKFLNQNGVDTQPLQETTRIIPRMVVAI